jgi:hypothetical protein
MAVNKTYETLTITAAGVTQAFSVNDAVQEYNVLASGGAVALAGNVAISSSGTPSVQTTFSFRFGGGFTLGAFSFTFFGVALTAAQALYEQYVTAVFNGSTWDVSIASDFSNGNKDINGADIINLSIPSGAIANQAIGYTKIANAALEGSIMKATVNGAWTALLAGSAGQLIVSDSLNPNYVTMSGDASIDKNGVITINNKVVGTAKIDDGAVTTIKLSADAAADMMPIACSFESGEEGAIKFKMPYTGTITGVYAIATKAIAATDNGTVVLKNNAGTTMTVTSPIVFAASDAFGTAYQSGVTANNSFVAGDLITVLTAKPTAGGKVFLSLIISRG